MRAAALAEELHTGQRRPDGQPYITHVVEVARLVLSWCPDADAAALVTALLHDAVEDQAARLAERGPDTMHPPSESKPSRSCRPRSA
jgi:guanosine-3',5'-bis(diphosphate) 3'-pyrophosphohydrolase